MTSVLYVAFILSTCAITLGQIPNSNPQPVGPARDAASNVGSNQPSIATTKLPPVAQLTKGPSPPNNNSSSANKCACAGVAGADGSCVAYNKRWQANTVDEAIEFFRSPLDFDQTKSSAMTKEEKLRVKAFFKEQDDESESSEETTTELTDNCEKDEKCTICLNGVYYLLAVRASIKDTNQSNWATLYSEIVRRLARESGIPFALVRDKCKQSPDKTMNTQAMFNVYNEVLRVLSCKTCMAQYTTSPTNKLNSDGHRIAKRQAVGTTIQVRCDYKRGQLVGDGTNYVGMCNWCWTVRQLPPEYKPRLLNEIACSSDATCLAGYGVCRPRYRATNVIYNNQYEVSINAQSGCECQIISGSAFYPYVNA